MKKESKCNKCLEKKCLKLLKKHTLMKQASSSKYQDLYLMQSMKYLQLTDRIKLKEFHKFGNKEGKRLENGFLSIN